MNYTIVVWHKSDSAFCRDRSVTCLAFPKPTIIYFVQTISVCCRVEAYLHRASKPHLSDIFQPPKTDCEIEESEEFCESSALGSLNFAVMLFQRDSIL